MPKTMIAESDIRDYARQCAREAGKMRKAGDFEGANAHVAAAAETVAKVRITGRWY